MQDQALRIYIAASHALQELGRRAREERGQTSVEWLGIIVVVAAIIAAIFASGALTDVAKAITDGVKTEIGKVLGH